MLSLISHLMRGTHVDLEAITMARARHLIISSPDDLVAHVDGEIPCTHSRRLECEILPYWPLPCAEGAALSERVLAGSLGYPSSTYRGAGVLGLVEGARARARKWTCRWT
jgi:hypothetical protein